MGSDWQAPSFKSTDWLLPHLTSLRTHTCAFAGRLMYEHRLITSSSLVSENPHLCVRSVIETGENKGGITVTGQLGDVMKESTSIALTVARGLLRRSHPDSNFFRDSRLHLHVPAGATPKDGPSAGCTMITSMLSLAMDK